MNRPRYIPLLLPLLLLACRSADPGLRPDPDECVSIEVPAIEWAPLHYAAPRATTPPVIDGRLDDPAWAAAPLTAEFTDIRGPTLPKPRHRTRARMLWDDDYLYIAAELVEPQLWATLTERDSVIFHDNDFEVFIDPDGDTHEYYEIEINALGTEWDLLVPKPYRDGGHGVNGLDLAGLRTAVHLDGTLNDPSDLDGGWTVEMAIPFASLAECAGRPCPPNPGDTWRLNFSRVQWRLEVVDGRYVKKPLPEDNWVWSPQGLINMHYPEMWGFVTFVEKPVGAADFEPDATERARWRLRQVYYAERDYFHRNGRFTSTPPYGPPEVRVSATTNCFEAEIDLPDGRILRMRQDGRILLVEAAE